MTRIFATLTVVSLVLSCSAGTLADEFPPDPYEPIGETAHPGDAPEFHIQLWDAHKTGWNDAALEEVARAGFTVAQHGWNGSLFPSRRTLDTMARHGLLYGAYIDTRHLFKERASSEEKLTVTLATNYQGERFWQLHTLDPVYQSVVAREVKRGIGALEGASALYKIMLNSEHGSEISYDDTTRAAAIEAGVLEASQRIPRYIRGVYAPVAADLQGPLADPVRFLRWYDNNANDCVINRIAAEVARGVRPGLRATTDPLADGYTYGQYAGMDILQDWVRVHRAPRDPLGLAYRTERLKAHLRHMGAGEIWIGPQLGSGKGESRCAAPADQFEEALWLAVAFGARGITCWGFDTIRRDNALDRDTWSRVRKFRDLLLGEYPWLLEATDAPRRCAVLLSKANFVLSGRVYYEVDENYEHFYRLLLTAHIPTDVLYDDDLLEGALSRYEALFLPGIEHLTEPLEEAIAAFESAGGRVVRTPFITLRYRDYEITKGNFDEDADPANPGGADLLPHQYRAFRHIRSARLFAAVSDLMDVTCDNPNVIMNVVEVNGQRRVILINDNRTYGAWTIERRFRWAEDDGHPASGTVTVGTGASAQTFEFDLPPAGITSITPSGVERSVTVKIDPASICTLSCSVEKL